MLGATRVALVTGASQGIGRAISLRLARDGYRIGLSDVESKKAQLEQVKEEVSQSCKVETCVIAADVRSEEEVKAMVEGTVRELGSVDVMVANGGIHSATSITDTTADIWDNMQAINARGVFLCYKYAAQEMIKQGRGGRIIGASSITGKQGFEGMSAYSASKFAVRGLTQAAAKDLARHGITVNAYAPGYVDTAMTRNLFKDDPEALLRDITKIPVARLAEGDDIAALVSFLASKDAEYITGQSMSINGGLYFD